MTTIDRKRVAIVFPADSEQMEATRLEQSRFSDVANALGAAGLEVVGAPYADALVEQVRNQLSSVDGVLVWINPVQAGHDRSVLNTLLTDVSSKSGFVSAHPEVIGKMGTKEVLYRTRSMSWGCDTQYYSSLDEMREKLPEKLATGPRVLKQIRGQSGDGIWKVEQAEPHSLAAAIATPDVPLRVRHAKRGSSEEQVSLAAFLSICRPYFAIGGGMIDQPYQPRLKEGMVRCYVIGDRVAGFGELLVNALYPTSPETPPAEAPLPGPRLYYPPTRPDFQRLKNKLEQDWIGEMCRLIGLERAQLPVLWDADFLYGPKDADGDDSYVLCEINVSSVYPFPPSALAPLVAETVARAALHASRAK